MVNSIVNAYAIVGDSSTKVSVSRVKEIFNKTKEGFSYRSALSYQLNDKFSVFAEHRPLAIFDRAYTDFHS